MEKFSEIIHCKDGHLLIKTKSKFGYLVLYFIFLLIYNYLFLIFYTDLFITQFKFKNRKKI